jgi:hypothetical protein
MLTPIFEGYTLKESNAVYDELAYVNKNIELALTYTNGETGISEINGENGNAKGIYDLTGRRLVGMPRSKGIYIINGKKHFVK